MPYGGNNPATDEPAREPALSVSGPFSRRNRWQFAAGLFGWMQTLHQATGGRIVAFDDKSLRRSGRAGRGLRPLHVVTAWATANSLVPGQVPCEEKSNEITAIPELLRLLNLRGATVTIDAMGCQKEIAAQIRDQKKHYLLGLKGNKPTLEAYMQELFEAALADDFAGVSRSITEDSGHGREEQRIVHALTIPRDHRQRAVWRDLNTLVAVTTCRRSGGEEQRDTRFTISSHASRAAQLQRAIRSHWSIENSQHHVLDVTFDEDHRRQPRRHPPSGAEHPASGEAHPRGARCERFTCALDPDYLNTVLASLTTAEI